MAHVKLFIFESVEDARQFSDERHVVLEAVSLALDATAAAPVEREEPKPHRKKRVTAKEAFKKRILEKAKAKAGASDGRKKWSSPTCKKCGGSGHRANHCPNGGLKVKEGVENFDSHEEDEG